MAKKVVVRTSAGIAGFDRAPTERIPRLLLTLSGLAKTGKTRFALTAPAPVYVQSFDTGTEGVIEQFAAAKDVYLRDYRLDLDENADEKQTLDAAKAAWAQFSADFHRLVDGGARTIVWDHADEVWEIIRLKEWGQLTNKPQFYSVVNAQYRALVRSVYNASHPVNLILLHKMKESWGEDSKGRPTKTGDYEVAGFKDRGYLTQGEIRLSRVGSLFKAEVVDSRHNAGLIGMEYEGEDVNFPKIASDIFGNEPEDWQ